MVEITLYCVVVSEGSVFPVKILAHETVATLKDLIKGKKPQSIACDADRLELYSIEGLIQNKDDQFVYNGTTIDMANCTLEFFEKTSSKMGARSTVSECLKDVNVPWKIHVLVRVPGGDAVNELSPSVFWVVVGSVENALEVKGVRSRLYLLADANHGYYDPIDLKAFDYDDKILKVHVLFKSEIKALDFD
ncbi:Aste57867_4323 [Aphanomyces stellatus]|uniref:Aste57867_4323 protein n=1 Tax=Aphanomyces stellatus TaxID=120398 RepID=A0A485KGH1_9STRA|nr:hypothetical protein As57867_004312 [Aphanomyces stellatus]VFT81437.1 Aste57867_4323 [Aphanomyces stellatus]